MVKSLSQLLKRVSNCTGKLLGGGCACTKMQNQFIKQPGELEEREDEQAKAKNDATIYENQNNGKISEQVQSNTQKTQIQSQALNGFDDTTPTTKQQLSLLHQKSQDRKAPVIRIVMQELGAGQFGSVVEVIDLMKNIIRAEKTLKDKNDYEHEKDIYTKLQNSFNLQQKSLLKSLAILPDEYEDTTNTIHFAVGQASLMNLKTSPKFHFTAQQIVHVFTRLLELLLLLREQGYCHSDFKPENVTLVPFDTDRYLAQIIDFGELTRNQLVPKGYTPNYFLNPARQYTKSGEIVFSSMDERYKNEFYTIIRTIHRILIEENALKTNFLLENEQIAVKKDECLQQMRNFWKQISLKSDFSNCKEFQLIAKFIIDKGIGDNYQVEELEELLQKLQNSQDFSKNYQYFIENKKIISQMVKTKRQEAAGKESAMSQLFGLESFVYQRGSRKTDYSEDFDLLREIQSLLLGRYYEGQTLKKKNIVLFGESGSGKSLFIIKLMQEIFKNSDFDDHLIVFYKLRDLSGDGDTTRQLTKLLEYFEVQTSKYPTTDKPILIFLDGFDELNNKQINIGGAIQAKYGDRATILVTSRPRYAVHSDFVECFGDHEQINICPFDSNQRDLYVQNSVAVFTKLKEKISDFETFETPLEYIQVLDKQQSLKNLAHVPFTLSLILMILPKLKKEQLIQAQKSQNHNFAKYEIQAIFEKQFTEREFKRVLLIDEYKEAVYEHYDVNQLFDITKDDDKMEELQKDLKIFHQLCSWKMLHQKQLKLQQADLDLIVQQILRVYEKDFTSILPILAKIAPVSSSVQGKLTYIHKTVYEFFIAQSVIEETVAAKMQEIDEKSTCLSEGYLAFDLDILSTIAEYINEMPLQQQYNQYFETWYKSLLLSRKIKKDQTDMVKLQTIGSNCVNLLAAVPSCDMHKRDFTDCDLPHAYFYKCDLSGSNFTRTAMKDCTLTDSKLNSCIFEQSDLRNLQYGRYPDFEGNGGFVNCLTLSHDGKIMFSGGEDKTIRFWSLESQSQQAILLGHTASVLSIALSFNGVYLATGSEDFTVRVWNVAERREVQKFEGHTKFVGCVKFSTHDKYLISGGNDSMIRIWNFSSWTEIFAIPLQQGIIYAITFSADGKYLATGNGDKTVKLWSMVNEWDLLVSLEGHTSFVNTVEFAPDCKYLASGSGDKTIRFWSTETYKTLFVLSGHSDNVKQISFSADGKYLASGSWDKSIKLWSVESQKEISTLQGHNGRIQSVVFSQDGKYLFSGSTDKTIKMWIVQSQKELVVTEGHDGQILSLSFSHDGKYLASGSKDKCIKIWSLESKKEFALLQGHNGRVLSVAFSQDSKYVTSSSDDKTVRVWSVETQKELFSLQGHSAEVFTVAFSPDGQIIASGCDDSTIKLWSFTEQKEIVTIEGGHFAAVQSLAFSPDGNTIASGSDDSTVKLWSVQQHSEIATFQGHLGEVLSVSFQPSGKQLASCSTDMTIKLWSVTEPYQELAQMQGHTSFVLSVTYSPDGQYLASASYDKTIKIWSVKQLKELATLGGHAGEVNTITFSSDGDSFASGSNDKTIKVWNFEQIQTGDLQRLPTVSIAANNFSNLFQIQERKITKFENEQSQICRIEEKWTISRNNVSFACTDAVFINCVFESKLEEERAQKVFKLYGCKTFENSSQ